MNGVVAAFPVERGVSEHVCFAACRPESLVAVAHGLDRFRKHAARQEF